MKRSITSFSQITSGDRIAVVSPTSIEAIALAKMAATHLGKDTALTPNMVTMTQPEAAQAFADGAETASALRADITNSSQTWTSVPHGYLRYAAFMKQAGLLSSAPGTMGPLEESTLAGNPGS